MESRKVQKVSAGTFIVSLPKQWAVRHNVKTGTVLGMTEDAAGSLVIDPHANRAQPKTPHLSDPESLEQSIIACYFLGAQTITVSTAGENVRVRTLTQLQELPGLEVAEETATMLTLKCLLDESTVRFYGLVDRLCVLLKYGVELALAGSPSAVQQNELEINRTYNLSQRILTKASHDAVFLKSTGISLARTIPTMQLLVKRLEHSGDALKELPGSLPKHVQRDIGVLIELICTMVRHLTAGKLGSANLPSAAEIRSLRKSHTTPQLLFLIRTAEDVLEELILLRTAKQLYSEA